ncbi:hypothetical protein BDA96_06G042800 [Sorghum bicolor]|uniref:Uncharacterized protein n=1 Tax=Sorghum bicolor TaxID=4558 RepID=A0A921QNE2_SORBI|nr:hypothetical protein BDA96_06G042800 [Sorghum bicolor]
MKGLCRLFIGLCSTLHDKAIVPNQLEITATRLEGTELLLGWRRQNSYMVGGDKYVDMVV